MSLIGENNDYLQPPPDLSALPVVADMQTRADIAEGRVVPTSSVGFQTGSIAVTLTLSGTRQVVNNATPADLGPLIEVPFEDQYAQKGDGWGYWIKDLYVGQLFVDSVRPYASPSAFSGATTLYHTALNYGDLNLDPIWPDSIYAIQYSTPGQYGWGRVVRFTGSSRFAGGYTWREVQSFYLGGIVGGGNGSQATWNDLSTYDVIILDWDAILSTAKSSYPPASYQLVTIAPGTLTNIPATLRTKILEDLKSAWNSTTAPTTILYGSDLPLGTTLSLPATISIVVYPKATSDTPDPGIARNAGTGVGIENTISPDEKAGTDLITSTLKGDGVAKGLRDPSNGYSSNGSTSGLNTIESMSGNLISKQHLVFLTAPELATFSAYGGGIITETGIYPTGYLYIESINLSMSGSSMTVVQNTLFDDTALLTIGKPVFGYVFSTGAETEPVFAGYVMSMSRRISDGNQEIVYECRDKKHLFDQFIGIIKLDSTQYTLKYLADEILLKAGLTDYENNLPETILPIQLEACTLAEALDTLCMMAGPYQYWVTNTGRLVIGNISTYGTTAGSYIIPTKGTPITASHKVVSFDGVVDYSNSRGSVVIVGGSVKKWIDRADKIPPLDGSQTMEDQAYAASNYAACRTGWNFIATSVNYAYGNIGTGTWVRYDAFYGVDVSGFEIDGNPYVSLIYRWTDEQQLAAAAYGISNQEKICNMVYFDKSRGFALFGVFNVTRSYTVGGYKITGDGVRNFLNDDITLHMRCREVNSTTDSLVKVYNTGNPGGTYLYKNSAFYVDTVNGVGVDTTYLMPIAAKLLSEYFVPVYGGNLQLHGIELAPQLGKRLSITNTSLPSAESTNLIIYGVTYNLPKRITTVELSTRVYQGIPYMAPEALDKIRQLRSTFKLLDIQSSIG